MKIQATAVVVLVFFCRMCFGQQPDLSGSWILEHVTVFEQGERSVDGRPNLFGQDVAVHFKATKTLTGYKVVPVKVDGTRPDIVIQIKLEPLGDRYRAEYSDSTGVKSLFALVEINGGQLRATSLMLTPQEIPEDFAPPRDKSVVKLVATFRRPDAEAVVTVRGPLGAIVAVGGGRREIGDEPITITTEKIPTDNIKPLDVSISHTVNGRLINDRMRLWLQGGTSTVADFSDIGEPDVASRTFRYWTSCRFTLYKGLNAAGQAKNDQERTKSLEKMATEMRHTPSRGVDKEAIEKWLAVVSATETAVANRKDGDANFYLESIFRGAAGDPFGASLDLQREVQAEMEAFRKALLEVKNFTPLLTQRYDTEFPIP
ncbi:MAG: hypothetical protein KDA88_22215 [Planctomycetaceae bacterium]|nr:hypothetical protein [Planctomycetaceae bacterium]MCA9033040.1 hypothetical protein [Planctomycetaceae bacterium]MCB9951639.1 hypothetical protein [Planctomycetaceae bacterium]